LTVKVTDGSGNTATSVPKTISLVVADFSQVKVYPNPWRSDKHSGHPSITFANLPLGSTVKVFTVSGRLVKSLAESSGQANWDLMTDSGQKAASGIYLYLMQVGDTGYGGNGQKMRGKIAVIK
jgi:hypothetical protein